MNKRAHSFTSAKADGGDGTLVRPSNWNASHDMGIEFTNRTGGTLASGDIVAIAGNNDESVVLSDVVDSRRKFLVSLGAPADLALGLFTDQGSWTMKVDAGGAIRGHYLAKSATAKSLAPTGRSAATTPPFPGDIAIALTGIGGAGTIIGQFIPSSLSAFLKGASVASANALLITSGATFHLVTGTTTITSIASAPAGHLVMLQFAGILTLQHSASLYLQKEANYITEANEILTFISDGVSLWRQVAPFHANLSYLRIGTAPATVGALRLANNLSMSARNVGNTVDHNLVTLNNTDQIVIGEPTVGSGNIRAVGQVRCDMDSLSRLVIPVGTNKWAT